MAHKLIHATDAKSGTVILINDEACTVKTNEISRPGKHGHAKCRISAIAIRSGKKKILAIPGHDNLEVPLVLKRRAQILSVGDSTASVMDLESYETVDVEFDDELKESLKPEVQVEYWDIEGVKLIKRVV